MSIKITKLLIKDQINKKTKKRANKPKFFYIDLEFEVTDGKEEWDNYNSYYDELLEWYKTKFLKPEDLDKWHKYIKLGAKKLSKALKTKNSEAINESMNDRTGAPELQDGWALGTGILNQLEKKGKTIKYSFSEYFTYTPITRGCITELKRIKANSTHSYCTIPEAYLAWVLRALARFWD